VGGAESSDWAAGATSRLLWETWNPWDDEARSTLSERCPVPGQVPLRARWHLLTDSGLHPPRAAAPLAWDEWVGILELEGVIDRGIADNDDPTVFTACVDLEARETAWPMRHVTVHSFIGRGDIARQHDIADDAIRHYETAIDIAVEDNYAFGWLRSAVPLGYLFMSHRSLREAADLFTKARDVAEALDERMYVANALIGLGEATGRLGDPVPAAQLLETALTLTRKLRSQVGTGNQVARRGPRRIQRERQRHRSRQRRGQARRPSARLR
jgi:hypothetical protein